MRWRSKVSIGAEETQGNGMARMGTVTQRQGRARLECDVEKGNGKAPQTAQGDGRAKEIVETSREGIATKRKERDAGNAKEKNSSVMD